jgi:uncharacterized protein
LPQQKACLPLQKLEDFAVVLQSVIPYFRSMDGAGVCTLVHERGTMFDSVKLWLWCSNFGVHLSSLLLAGLISFPAVSDEVRGTLNPEEGGIAQIREALVARPDRTGFLCWVVYEAQKGGLHDEAMDALNDCADAGNEPSMILLAHAYENGLGVPRDAVQATRWLKEAAMRFYPTGQYHYGMALLHGTGVTKDEGQARFWLERAAMGGDRDAAAELEKLLPQS